MESREMKPTKQEIFSMLPKISRKEGTLTNDRNVWSLWQAKMDASRDPNFITPFIYINLLILLSQFLHSLEKLNII